MFSDACMQQYATGSLFQMILSGTNHVDWLRNIKEALLTLGIPVSSVYPRLYGPYLSKGKAFIQAHLKSRVCNILTPYHDSWYARGRKEIPRSFTLTPVSLANAFMGDGCGYNRKGHIRLSLSTCGFSIDSIERAEHALDELGLGGFCKYRNMHVRNGSGIELYSSSRELMRKFMTIVEPYMMPSFAYKLIKL